LTNPLASSLANPSVDPSVDLSTSSLANSSASLLIITPIKHSAKPSASSSANPLTKPLKSTSPISSIPLADSLKSAASPILATPLINSPKPTNSPITKTNTIIHKPTSDFDDYDNLINAKCYKYIFIINQQIQLNKFKQKLNKLKQENYTNCRPLDIDQQANIFSDLTFDEILKLYNIKIHSSDKSTGYVTFYINKNMLKHWTSDPNLMIQSVDMKDDKIDILWYNTESKSENLIYIELLFFLLNIQNDYVVNTIKHMCKLKFSNK